MTEDPTDMEREVEDAIMDRYPSIVARVVATDKDEDWIRLLVEEARGTGEETAKLLGRLYNNSNLKVTTVYPYDKHCLFVEVEMDGPSANLTFGTEEDKSNNS